MKFTSIRQVGDGIAEFRGPKNSRFYQAADGRYFPFNGETRRRYARLLCLTDLPARPVHLRVLAAIGDEHFRLQSKATGQIVNVLNTVESLLAAMEQLRENYPFQ